MIIKCFIRLTTDKDNEKYFITFRNSLRPFLGQHLPLQSGEWPLSVPELQLLLLAVQRPVTALGPEPLQGKGSLTPVLRSTAGQFIIRNPQQQVYYLPILLQQFVLDNFLTESTLSTIFIWYTRNLSCPDMHRHSLNHGALQLKEMNNRTGSITKHVWSDAMHVLHNFGCFVINVTAYRLGQYKPSSASTKEFQVSTFLGNW